MLRYKLEIQDLGRSKINKIEVVNEISFESLSKIVKPHLLSKDIGFSVERAKKEIHVFAGFRDVGVISWSEIYD